MLRQISIWLKKCASSDYRWRVQIAALTSTVQSPIQACFVRMSAGIVGNPPKKPFTSMLFKNWILDWGMLVTHNCYFWNCRWKLTKQNVLHTLTGNVTCVFVFNHKSVDLKPSFSNILKCLSIFDILFLCGVICLYGLPNMSSYYVKSIGGFQSDIQKICFVHFDKSDSLESRKAMIIISMGQVVSMV